MSFLAEITPGIFRRLTFRHTSHSKNWRMWSNRLALILIGLSAVSGFATYAALSELPPFGDDPNIVIWLLNLDFVLLLLLVILIAQRLVGVWSGRKRGLAGSHLHVRLVYIFSLLAALPAIIMTIFSAFFFHYGVQAWFSQRVQTAVNESQAVAQAYLEEHKEVLRSDVMIMANDLNAQQGFLIGQDDAFDQKVMSTHSRLRNLPEAVVFNAGGDILSRSSLTFALGFEDVPSYAVRQAQGGDVVILRGGNADDRLRALVKLEAYRDAYLFVGRMIDPQVLSHLRATQEATDEYENLQTRYAGLRVTVIMIFVVVGFLLVLAAIWFGLMLARQLVQPITSFISTADRVRGGDYTARVSSHGKVQEFDYLALSFNRMTEQIEQQQSDLIDANRLLDGRRHFIEMVLSGVSSGVIGLGADGRINLANFSAANLLGRESSEIAGEFLVEIVPEFADILSRAYADNKHVQGELEVHSEDGAKRMFLVRIAVESSEDRERNAIVTFDDITALQSAQRKAAWSDVARRIAHEIKNPLTPIQLSAERLKRRYSKQIEDDKDVFEQCTDTIIRHVGDIGRMVDEFSSFARMPAPSLQDADLAQQAQEALFLQKQAYPAIEFSLEVQDGCDYSLQLDTGQIRQALTNLLQNAVDSVQARCAEDDGHSGQIDIVLGMSESAGGMALIVSDNGMGLPNNESAERLTEPYVTHKQKGTGLGLAIVKKVMEDHNGELLIGKAARLSDIKAWRDLGGASIAFLFPSSDQHKG